MVRDMQVDYYVAAIYGDLVSNEFTFFLKHGNTPWEKVDEQIHKYKEKNQIQNII